MESRFKGSSLKQSSYLPVPGFDCRAANKAIRWSGRRPFLQDCPAEKVPAATWWSPKRLNLFYWRFHRRPGDRWEGLRREESSFCRDISEGRRPTIVEPFDPDFLQVRWPWGGGRPTDIFLIYQFFWKHNFFHSCFQILLRGYLRLWENLGALYFLRFIALYDPIFQSLLRGVHGVHPSPISPSPCVHIWFCSSYLKSYV